MAEFFAGLFTGAFVFGGFWFWFIAAVIFAAVLAFEEHENNIGAGILIFVYGWNVFHFNADVFSTWTMVTWATYFGSYFVLGGVWSFLKWFSFVRSRAERYVELKLMWKKKIQTGLNKYLEKVQEGPI